VTAILVSSTTVLRGISSVSANGMGVVRVESLYLVLARVLEVRVCHAGANKSCDSKEGKRYREKFSRHGNSPFVRP
jgi:hypothetical protein